MGYTQTFTQFFGVLIATHVYITCEGGHTVGNYVDADHRRADVDQHDRLARRKSITGLKYILNSETVDIHDDRL